MDGKVGRAELDLVVVGGCGQVGLPLALSCADVGCRVRIYDTNGPKVEQIRGGHMPFQERGADELLSRLLPTERLGPDRPLRLLHDPGFEHDVQRRIHDGRKERERLGFDATTSLEKMLDEVMPWIKIEIEAGRI